ncbi:hypothetical protein Micbo1qcDRAFT_161062, partial [Microdochium bolleyi]
MLAWRGLGAGLGVTPARSALCPTASPLLVGIRKRLKSYDSSSERAGQAVRQVHKTKAHSAFQCRPVSTKPMRRRKTWV